MPRSFEIVVGVRGDAAAVVDLVGLRVDRPQEAGERRHEVVGTEQRGRRVGGDGVPWGPEHRGRCQPIATGMRVRWRATWVTSRSSPTRWLSPAPVTSTVA